MNFENLEKIIEHGLYPDPNSMQGNLDYALRRRKITTEQYIKLSELLESKEQAKYK